MPPPPPPSSKRYLTVWACVALLLLIVLGAWSLRSIRQNSLFYRLYSYQLDKLAMTPEPVDTVFVGDSTLGEAIDARLFGELSHSHAINLALTGAYGYAGDYNMLRRVLRRFKPRNVVIFHTADMLKRETDEFAYLMSVDTDSTGLDWFAVSMFLSSAQDYLKLIFNVRVFLQGAGHLFDGEPRPLILPNDYPDQFPPLHITPERIARETLQPGISLEKLRFLKETVALCRSAAVNCVYAQSPLLDGICATSGVYIEQASQAIRSTGLTLLEGTPLCMPAKHVGDATDHVRPEYKAAYTRAYYSMLAPLLR